MKASPSQPTKSIERKEFWYIDCNGRVQYSAYQPEKIDESAEWFGNVFDSCDKAILARDKIRKILYKDNPAKNEKPHWRLK